MGKDHLSVLGTSHKVSVPFSFLPDCNTSVPGHGLEVTFFWTVTHFNGQTLQKRAGGTSDPFAIQSEGRK